MVTTQLSLYYFDDVATRN